MSDFSGAAGMLRKKPQSETDPLAGLQSQRGGAAGAAVAQTREASHAKQADIEGRMAKAYKAGGTGETEQQELQSLMFQRTEPQRRTQRRVPWSGR